MEQNKNEEILKKISELKVNDTVRFGSRNSSVKIIRSETGLLIEPYNNSSDIFINGKLLISIQSVKENDVIQIKNKTLVIPRVSQTLPTDRKLPPYSASTNRQGFSSFSPINPDLKLPPYGSSSLNPDFSSHGRSEYWQNASSSNPPAASKQMLPPHGANPFILPMSQHNAINDNPFDASAPPKLNTEPSKMQHPSHYESVPPFSTPASNTSQNFFTSANQTSNPAIANHSGPFMPFNVKQATATLSINDGVQTVMIKGEARNILNHVTVSANQGEFLGVVGGSGSGKSTLLKAIAGLNIINSGEILLHGHPISREDLLSDKRIAYLPQDVVIHEALTAMSALKYIAELKEVGSTSTERDTIIYNALKRTGMEEHANTPIKRLSGGQRKRVALAGELLGDPEIILLDEATSGLDPATETEMMHLFKSLANDGKTVICITHFPKNLFLCDRLLYMMKGNLIFSGTMAECLKFFNVKELEEIYVKQEEHSPEEWKQIYESKIGPFQLTPPSRISAIDTPSKFFGVADFIKQLYVLSKRYCHLQMIDVKNCLLLFLQAPIIALMIGLSYGAIPTDEGISGLLAKQATSIKGIIFSMILSILWCSGTSSVREIVKEMPILTHEIRFGVKTGIYLLSKIIFLSFFVLIQALMLLIIVQYITKLPGNFQEQLVILFFSGISGIAIGLFVSPLSKNVERAMTLLPVILIGQAIFSGGLAKLETVTKYFSWIVVPAYWSLEGLIGTFSQDLREASMSGRILGDGSPYLQTSLVLSIMSIIPLLGTWFILKKDFSGGVKSKETTKNLIIIRILQAIIIIILGICIVFYVHNSKKSESAGGPRDENIGIIPLTEPFEKRLKEAKNFINDNMKKLEDENDYAAFLRAKEYLNSLQKSDRSVYGHFDIAKKQKELNTISENIQKYKDDVSEYLKNYKTSKDYAKLVIADKYMKEILKTAPYLEKDKEIIEKQADIEKEKIKYDKEQEFYDTCREIMDLLRNYKNDKNEYDLNTANKKYDEMIVQHPDCKDHKEVKQLDFNLKKANVNSALEKYQKNCDEADLKEAEKFVNSIDEKDLDQSERSDYRDLQDGLKKIKSHVKEFKDAVEEVENSLKKYKQNSITLEKVKELAKTEKENKIYEELKKQHDKLGSLQERPKKGTKAGTRLEFTIQGIKIAFRWCPPGTFSMGSPENEKKRSDDEKQHTVTLTKGFWILEHEVTQEIFAALMPRTSVHPFFHPDNPKYITLYKYAGVSDIRVKNTRLFPIEGVSFSEAEQFCENFSKLFLPGPGKFELPTEAQWEYACRAGTFVAHPVDLENVAYNRLISRNFNYKGLDNVKQFIPNNWGIYDMQGSVYEWCSDWYDKYPEDSVIDPKGPKDPIQADKVVRGGYWGQTDERYCRAASRAHARPAGFTKDEMEKRFGALGFRFVFNPDEEDDN